MDKARAFDLVIGNPPYKHTEQFVRHGMDMLESGGYLVFLLRLNFLEGQGRGRSFWNRYPPVKVVVSSRRVSFSGDGKSNATAYAYFVWQQGYTGETKLAWAV